MKYKFIVLFVTSVFVGSSLKAQVFSKEDMVYLTSEWKGERFDDGRPKISDDLVERAKAIGMDDAWTVLRNEGYNNQFERNWDMVHNDVKVVGRALTAQYMPSRPDLEKLVLARGHKNGHVGSSNAWPIDLLTKGDVYVADGFGKVTGGTLIGSTLGTSIYDKSGNGVIFDGGARDLEGLLEIEGFNAYVRGFDPSFLEESVVTDINAPIRIGNAIVMPGDLVIAEREGVLFVPAHLAEKVILTAEFVSIRDEFGFEMIKNGTYTTGEIDNEWPDQIKEDFLKWLDRNPGKLKMTRAQLDEFMSKRTW